MRRVILVLFSPTGIIITSIAGRGGGGALPDFLFFTWRFFPCSADRERNWPPSNKVVKYLVVFSFFRFFGSATKTNAECEKQQQKQRCLLPYYTYCNCTRTGSIIVSRTKFLYPSFLCPWKFEPSIIKLSRVPCLLCTRFERTSTAA